MHLTNKQLLLLLTPLMFAVVIWLLGDTIVGNLRYFFPDCKEYKSRSFDRKISLYMGIKAKKVKDERFIKMSSLVAKESDWIVYDVLYKPKIKIKKIKQKRLSYESYKPIPIKLNAIFYSFKTAIVNGKLVKEKGLINKNIKLDKIEKDRILIQDKKGKRWVYLFH